LNLVQVQVIYCLHELARLCAEQRLAPFFTGTVDERAQAREEWASQNLVRFTRIYLIMFLSSIYAYRFMWPNDVMEDVLVFLFGLEKSRFIT